MSQDAWNVVGFAITAFLIAAVSAVGYYARSAYATKKQRELYEAVHSFIWEMVLAAEKKFQDRGQGQDKLAWVQQMVAQSPFAKYANADLVEAWVNYMLKQYEAQAARDG